MLYCSILFIAGRVCKPSRRQKINKKTNKQDTSMKKKYTASRYVFGSVKLIKLYCPKCDDYTLISQEKVSTAKCDCGSEFQNKQIKKTFVIVGEKRIHLTKKQKLQILERQNNKCFFCNIDLDDYIVINGFVRKIRTHYDHFMPYSITTDNSLENLNAACSRCNLMKNAKVFANIKEARKYLFIQWENDIASGKIECNDFYKRYDEFVLNAG